MCTQRPFISQVISEIYILTFASYIEKLPEITLNSLEQYGVIRITLSLAYRITPWSWSFIQKLPYWIYYTNFDDFPSTVLLHFHPTGHFVLPFLMFLSKLWSIIFHTRQLYCLAFTNNVSPVVCIHAFSLSPHCIFSWKYINFIVSIEFSTQDRCFLQFKKSLIIL